MKYRVVSVRVNWKLGICQLLRIVREKKNFDKFIINCIDYKASECWWSIQHLWFFLHFVILSVEVGVFSLCWRNLKIRSTDRSHLRSDWIHFQPFKYRRRAESSELYPKPSKEATLHGTPLLQCTQITNGDSNTHIQGGMRINEMMSFQPES
jgi:hypothetical protein